MSFTTFAVVPDGASRQGAAQGRAVAAWSAPPSASSVASSRGRTPTADSAFTVFAMASAADVVRLRALCADPDAIASGWRSSAGDLGEAPLIAGRRNAVVLTPTLALRGVVAGHPRVGGGCPALTITLSAIDAEASRARTFSGSCRLGRRAYAEDPQ
jgi:hypothetical protein